jgi:hypothetical protein
MKKFFIQYKDILATLVAFALILTPLAVSADFTSSPSQRVTGGSTLLNPLNGNINSVCDLVIALVKAAIAIGIPIAILFIVWAGLKFVLAQGNPGKIGEAQRNLLHVVIGIAIFIGSSLIANVIINTLQQLGVQGINSC